MSEENKNLEESQELSESTETSAEVAEAAEETAEAAEETAESSKKEKPKKNKRKFNMRSLKYGTMSVVLTIVFIGVLVAVNVIVGLISERFDTTADLTDTGIYTLEDSTHEFVAALDKDVTITVLNSEKSFESLGEMYKQVNELLKKFEMANSRVKLDYIVLAQNPNYSSRFKGETLSDNYIVVECEETGRHKTITPFDYFTFNEQYLTYYQQYVVEGSNIEQETVSALMAVTNDDPVRVAFTEGYGESAAYYGELYNLLDKNGYDVETINLTQISEIDTGIDYVVVFAPTMDYDNDNLSKLDKFLDNGGNFGKNVLYFASTAQPQTPNIEKFLNDWGLSVGYSGVGQTDASHCMGSGVGYYWHYQEVQPTDYAGDAADTSLYFYAANIRPVIQIWGGSKGSVEQEVLLKTYDGAFLMPLENQDGWSLDTAESGVFNDAVVAYRTHSTALTRSRLIVFGTETIASSTFMQPSNSVNELFFVNMFNYISGREQGVTITPKSFGYTGFEMNAQQAGILGIVLCVVIPIVVIVLGVVIWIRRRHR